MKILYIAPIKIDANASAGAETINIYINQLAKMGNEVCVLAFSEGRFKQDNITYQILNVPENKRSVNKYVKALGWIFYPNNRYLYKTTHAVRKEIEKQLTELSGKADVVMLETASAYLLWDIVKKCMHNAKIVASVHDVAYQGSWRKMQLEESPMKRKLRRRYCRAAKDIEVNALSHVDLIMPHNRDNIELLKKNKTIKEKEYFPLVPYYETGFKHNDATKSRDILFYGLMRRPENYESACWFLDNVFPKLDDSFQFIVMGGNPPESIIKRASDRVVVTGFVEEEIVKAYFENSFCMVASLLYGSGIKTKIVSAFCAGLPVLTNEIGIEGIPASRGIDYIHCDAPDDYVKGIEGLASDSQMYTELCEQARRVVEHGFNHEKCARELNQKLAEQLKMK